MNIAEQLKRNSKLANERKAKRSLAKTLAEKRLKAKILAEQKEKERVALEKKKKAAKAEEAKRAIEAANLKTLKKYFDSFYLTAWHGNSQFVTIEKDGNRDELLKPFGLTLLSTEEYCEKLNRNLLKINELIEEINYHLISIGFKKNVLIPECAPKDILKEQYNFAEIWSARNSLLNGLQEKINQNIKSLEQTRLSIKNEINFTKNATTRLANSLMKLARTYSREDSKAFKDNYELLLHSPPVSVLNNMPELKKLTYSERIDNRNYQYQIARETFARLNLTLPSLEQMQLSPKSQISDKAWLFSETDGIGRYIAFFNIFCGGDAYSAILRSVKEKIHSNNAENLIHEERRLSKTELLLQSDSKKLEEMNISSLRKIATEIRKRISNLRVITNQATELITFNATSFESCYLFDLTNLRISSAPTTPFNQLIIEIQWLLSKAGISNVRKLIRTLESASTKGLRSLQLSYQESDNKIIFCKDGKQLFELFVSLDNFLSMLKKDKLSYTLKTSKTSNLLTIKWL